MDNVSQPGNMLIFEESSLDDEEIAFDEKGQGIEYADVFCY